MSLRRDEKDRNTLVCDNREVCRGYYLRVMSRYSLKMFSRPLQKDLLKGK